MVPALPALPPAPGGGTGPAAGTAGSRPASTLHTRRPDSRDRRLPGDPTGAGAAGPHTDGTRAAGAGPVAGIGGLLPVLRREPAAQPGDRPPPRRRTRRRHAHRLPAGPVRPRGPTPADPPPRGHRHGMRLARRAGGGAYDGVLVAVAGRHDPAHALPARRRLRRRGGRVRRGRRGGRAATGGGACTGAETVAADGAAAGDVRHGPLGAGRRAGGFGGGGCGRGGADSARHAGRVLGPAGQVSNKRWQRG
ncbi:hypothetical protein ABH920_002184 [Catenulispora sp. EB89]